MSSSAGSSGSISVATYNVYYKCQAPTNQLVLDKILDCGVDVVTLQEVNDDWETFLRNSNRLCQAYPNIRFHNPPGNAWAGYAVLSKYPIDQWTVIPNICKWWFPAGCLTIQVPQCSAGSLPATPATSERSDSDDPCGCGGGAVVARSDGELMEQQEPANKEPEDNPTKPQPTGPYRTIQLLVVHLRAPVEISEEPFWWGSKANSVGMHVNWISGYFGRNVREKRLEEIQTFAKALDPSLPTVVLGDFNERRRSSPCLTYLAEEFGLVTLDKVNQGGRLFGSSSCCGGQCCTHSWSFEICCGMVPLFAMDYDHVLYSPNLLECVGNFATIHQDGRGSDHRLVSAEFRFSHDGENS